MPTFPGILALSGRKLKIRYTFIQKDVKRTTDVTLVKNYINPGMYWIISVYFPLGS